MNGLLGNMFGGGANGTSILLQAVGAALRGESPQDFLRRLSNQHPQLKKINFNDLQGEAQRLCQQNGINPNELAQQLDSVVDPMIKR